jgi:hypothetical protein
MDGWMAWGQVECHCKRLSDVGKKKKKRGIPTAVVDRCQRCSGPWDTAGEVLSCVS